jgi:hypothetical protein
MLAEAVGRPKSDAEARFAARLCQSTRRNERVRRLKLQMQVSIDGMVAVQSGHAHFKWDEEVRQYSIANAANVDCILLGPKPQRFHPSLEIGSRQPQRC